MIDRDYSVLVCINCFNDTRSDGPQPHSVNIQFVRKTLVKELALYLDYKQDESYTPSKISVRAGTHFHDLQVNCTSIVEMY